METMRKLLCLAAGVAAIATVPVAVAQQGYPARPVRVIVGWPPGGAGDVTGRVMGQKLAELIGQQVLIDNRAGASGAIGAELAAKSAPDGYTLFIGTVTDLVLNTQIVKVPYDPMRDFAPVSPFAFGYYVMVVHPSLPVKSVKELIALAKARPGEINYASGGSGTNLSLVAELFNATAGIKISHVPYKGGGPAGIAVMSGESQMMFAGIASTIPYLNAQRLRALALTGPKRSSLLPGTPTFAESDVAGMDVGLWFGLLAPAATPRAIVTRLNAEIVKLAATADYRTRIENVGFEPFTASPEKFSEFLRTELEIWGKVIRAAGVKAE